MKVLGIQYYLCIFSNLLKMEGYSNKTNKGLSSEIKLPVPIYIIDLGGKDHCDSFLPKNTV